MAARISISGIKGWLKAASCFMLLCLCSIAKAEDGNGQDHKIDSLVSLINKDTEDTNKVNHLNSLSLYYNSSGKADKALELGNEAVTLSQTLNYAKGLTGAYNAIGAINFSKKDYHGALSCFEKALNVCEKGKNEDKPRVVIIFDNIGLSYEAEGEYGKSQEYYNKAMKIAEEIGDKQLQAYTMGNIGNFYTMQGNDSKALEYYLKAVKMKEELGDKNGAARSSNNIAMEYKGQGDYPKAMEFYNNALKMADELGDKQLQANITSNIGALYREQSQYSKALEYDFKALKLAEDLKYKQLQASTASNIGLIYWKRSDYSRALEYYNKALKMAEESGDKSTAAVITDNIGIVCENQGDFPEALDYEFKALKISKDIGDKAGIAINTESIGEIYIKQKKYKDAEKYILEALYLSDTIHLLEATIESNLNLSELFSQTGQWQKAFESYKQYVAAKDSLASKDNSREIGKLEAKADYNKQALLQKADEDKKAAIEEIERKRRRVLMGLVAAIALAVAIIALIIFRSLRTTRMQKTVIEHQKEEVEHQKLLVEERNKDILDSITYAKRLQDAILPPIALIKQYFPECFVLYKPKEIVAGDFYWMQKSGEAFLIAAADCTGHGVPGAMVSVVCSNALNRTVKEFGITEPGMILDKVKELVKETFSQRDPLGEKSQSEVKDGMDISLCSINITTGEFKWSGANSPLWYLQNGTIKELIADDQVIGNSGNTMSFTTHNAKLQKGDMVYLFTDGYAAQLSGNAKEGNEMFKKKLFGFGSLSMDKQKEALEEMLKESNGASEQVDDILVIGIRV